MRELIAIVDDEPDILELVTLALRKARFTVKAFPDARGLQDFLNRLVPDLVLLDLMLPDGNGFDICKELKRDSRFSAVPVIMLTARADESDRILGLELGADDYVTKPFSTKELVARIKAVLRRHRERSSGRRINVGNLLAIDLEKYEVRVEDRAVDLTPTEFRILQLLASHQGWVYARDQILEFLWGRDKAVIDRTVDVHIKHLREKLGPSKGMIKNVRGVGYKLEL